MWRTCLYVNSFPDSLVTTGRTAMIGEVWTLEISIRFQVPNCCAFLCAFMITPAERSPAPLNDDASLSLVCAGLLGAFLAPDTTFGKILRPFGP